MNRRVFRRLLACFGLPAALLFLLPSLGMAQKPPRLKIEDVQVGFGSSSKAGRKDKKDNATEEEDDSSYLHQGRFRVATMGDVNKLPKAWFAYEPADQVILTTGKRDSFLTALLNEREGRKEALVEWVRRGGNLLISVARNQDVLRDREFEVLTNLMPVAVP